MTSAPVDGAVQLLRRRGYPADALSCAEVAFDAGDDLVAPLTWGQERVAMLQDALHPTHATLNIRFAERLRAGVTVDEVLRAVSTAVEDCAALRTLFRTDADTPYQEVRGRGVLEVTVLETGVPADLSPQAVADDLASQEFAPTDLPSRFCVLACSGVPSSLVVVTSHLSADYFGAGWLQWHLRDVLARTFGRGYGRPTPAQPADVSEWEQSEEGTAAGRKSVALHAQTFDNMPACVLPRLPSTPLEPRYQYLELRSSSAARCVAHLSARHGVSESAVVHGAWSLLLARVSGLLRTHLQVCVSNRVDQRFGSVVGPMTQDVPTWLEVGRSTFDELVRRSGRVLLAAATRGRFPTAAMEAERRRAEESRGVRLDLSYWLNSRLGVPFTQRDQPTTTELADLRARSTVEPLGGDSTSTSTLFVYVDRVGDVLHVRIMVDTMYIDSAEGSSWLTSLDELLSAAALGCDDVDELAERSGLSAPVRGEDWVFVDHSWIHLPTVADELRTSWQVDPLELAVQPSSAGELLVAVLADDDFLRAERATAASLGSKVAMLPTFVRRNAHQSSITTERNN